MPEVLPFAPRPSLALAVSRAVCFATCDDCRRPEDCPFCEDGEVVQTLDALADVLACDAGLARKLGRNAVTTLVQHLRGR
jgi:hypothetical protein